MSYAIKNYMEKEFQTIDENAAVIEAAKQMSQDEGRYRGYLIVLNKGSPIGIVTERDLVNKILAQGVDPSKTKVSEVMSAPLITIDPEEDLLKAAELMQQKGVRKLPVVRSGIIYGIITADDIAQKCGTYVDKTIKDILRWTAPLGL